MLVNDENNIQKHIEYSSNLNIVLNNLSTFTPRRSIPLMMSISFSANMRGKPDIRACARRKLCERKRPGKINSKCALNSNSQTMAAASIAHRPISFSSAVSLY